jgi:hypothetical protein
MLRPGQQRGVSQQLPDLEVGERFTVDEIPHLPPVELVRKLPTTWVVAEVKPDGSRDRWKYRLSKAALVGKTVKLLSKEFRPEAQVVPTLPPVPPSEDGIG